MYRHRRRSQPVEQEQLDRWLVSYADYMTLMFALFVVLYSMALIKEEPFKILSETLVQVFDNKTEQEGTGVVGEGLLTTNEQVNTEHQLYGTSIVEERGPELLDGRIEVSNITNKKIGHPLEGLAKELDNALFDLVENDIAKVKMDTDWLTIELNSAVMFASGSAAPTQSAAVVLKEVVGIIGPVENYVRVRGYTDDLPIQTEFYASNWELSVARATAALKILQSMGINPARMAIEGYGQYSPFTENNTAKGRNENRKVVIALSKYAFVAANFKLPDSKSVDNAQQTLSEPAKGTVQDYNEVQVIQLPEGGIRITTRSDNPDAVKQNNSNKDDKGSK